MEVLVARIGRPHGLRGEVTVQTHTDTPRERFVRGAVFETRPSRGTLTLRSARPHQGVWLLAFEEAADRSAAEALRGSRLVLDVPVEGVAGPSGRADAAGSDAERTAAAGDPAAADDVVPEEGWYPDELVGLPVRDVAGAVIGEVTQLLTRPAQDLLQVRLLDGRTGLVPFVAALVPSVVATGDRAQRHVVLDAPAGLFDLG